MKRIMKFNSIKIIMVYIVYRYKYMIRTHKYCYLFVVFFHLMYVHRRTHSSAPLGISVMFLLKPVGKNMVK